MYQFAADRVNARAIARDGVIRSSAARCRVRGLGGSTWCALPDRGRTRGARFSFYDSEYSMFYVLGIDAGGTKTMCYLADESGAVIAESRRGGANLQAVGELQVEKTLHEVME